MIAAQDGGIMLYKLRQPNEVRKMDDVPQIERKYHYTQQGGVLRVDGRQVHPGEQV